MRPPPLAALFLLAFALPGSHAGWTIYKGHLEYSTTEALVTIEEAVKLLGDENTVQNLRFLKPPLLDEKFQQELLAILERDAPRELKEALQSSGNAHNPKMNQLSGPFQKAVLATAYVQGANRDLAPYGLRITKVALEEFHLQPTPKGRRLYGILSVQVEKAEK